MANGVPVEDFGDQINDIVDDNDEEEEREHLTIIQVNPLTAREEELRLTLTRVLHKYIPLRVENKALKRENRILRSSASSSARKSALEPLEILIKTIGRKYCVLLRLWTPDRLFPATCELIDPADPERWTTDNLQLRGFITDLVRFLEPKIRTGPLIQYTNFGAKFTEGVNSEHGTFVSAIKDNMAKIYTGLGIDTETLNNADAFAKHPRVCFLLTNPDPKEAKNPYPDFPRILHADPDNPDWEECFMAPVLIRAARLILFGPTVLGVRGGSGGRTPKGELWDLKHIPAGFITNVAIAVHILIDLHLVVHRMTPDDSLNVKGKSTQIMWPKRHDLWYKFLSSKVMAEWAANVFGVWDVECLQTNSADAATTSSPDPQPSYADEMFAKLAAPREERRKTPSPPAKAPFGSPSPELPPTILPSVSSGPQAQVPPPAASVLPSVSSGPRPEAPAPSVSDPHPIAALDRQLNLLSIGGQQSSINIAASSGSPSSILTSPPASAAPLSAGTNPSLSFVISYAQPRSTSLCKVGTHVVNLRLAF
ncbi:hypothetical protein CONPUDRAFT_77455 [Coniophora puteana RWD-64-598 SS2]|uniref:Uncharacterized protein n=1 Tax=Coniophora puteana (strain RWD-64-598) TaxID=741705 RepID=A0A5M3M8J3_CONPW|nr:uncharacterized protein CONPUDRAFT_77455 [Coniophora puteana RWD-64-598 SS2]EIW75194.1 hypothetical protein CONPUDRAFT_77455 [Coniophora puteana RWD-64-598 SS2]